MENVKRKGREVVNKNNGSKVKKKSQKKMRKKKAKGKENFEALIAGYKSCRLTAEGALKGQRAKKRPTYRGNCLLKDRRVDGMFLRGIRTEYITREGLNEANEARKREDINKIIDMGRVFCEKGELPVPRGRAGERVTAAKEKRKPGKSSPDSGESSADGVAGSSLSSISPEDDARPRPPETPPLEGKMNVKTELRAFALKYEATVAARILHKLPDSGGVLEDALLALRKLQGRKKQNSAPVSPDLSPRLRVADAEGGLFPKEFQFLRADPDWGPPPAEDFDLPRGFLESEHFVANSSGDGNVFIMNAKEPETPNHPSGLTLFDEDEVNKSSSAIEFHAKDFQKPVKELSIATPPFHFYPRNMF